MAIQRNARRTLVLTGAVFIFCSCGAPDKTEKVAFPIEEESFTREDAKNLYILHCENCHGIDGTKQFANAADLSKSTLNDQQIKAMILNGNDKGMMPYRDIITSEKERSALVEFVKSLQKQ